jgi:hypothetical protein
MFLAQKSFVVFCDKKSHIMVRNGENVLLHNLQVKPTWPFMSNSNSRTYGARFSFLRNQVGHGKCSDVGSFCWRCHLGKCSWATFSSRFGHLKEHHLGPQAVITSPLAVLKQSYIFWAGKGKEL